MKHFLLITLFIPLVGFCQIPEFIITDVSNIEPIIVEVKDNSSSVLFTKTLEWLNLTFKNPEKVIKGNVDSDFIRFSGFKSSFAKRKIMGSLFYYDFEYTIRIDFKEGKYRFSLEEYAIISPSISPELSKSTLEFYKRPECLNKKGELKDAYVEFYKIFSEGILIE